MAILRSVDGRFFEIPDDQVERYLIPEDQVKAKLESAGAPMVPPSGAPSGPEAGPGPGPGAATIVVQIYGATQASMAGGAGAPPPSEGPAPEVQPYYWNNWWHNRRPHWNNWWHNWHR